MGSAADSLRYPGAYVETAGDKPAVVMSDSGATLTFAELDAYANRFARVLAERGVGVGGHVAICMENRLEIVALHHGAHYAGAYYTLIGTRLTANEIGYIIVDCGARVVVVSATTAPPVLSALAGLRDPPAVFNVDDHRGTESLAPALAAADPGRLVGAVDGSEMLYSSGTTGKPKGVRPPLPATPLGTTNVIADLGRQAFGFSVNTVYLSPAPYYHSAPSKWSQAVIACGGTVIMMPRFDAESALAAIDRYQVTHSQWVPTMFQRMLRLPESVRCSFDLSSQQVAIHAAAPCPVPVKRQMIDWWGPIVHEFYASTEGTGLCHCDSEQWLAHPGTVGRAIFGQIHILDVDLNELPAGEPGDIYFSGGRPFSYHNDPDKTAKAHAGDGLASVGDVGYVDGDGYLYLTDRRSNMIITGGVNVYPQETEDTLAVHPTVADVAVIGVPNDDFGEEVRAVVQVVDGVEADETLAEALIAFCRERLADVKCPRAIDFRSELPREPNGKLLKRKLRDEYWAGRESRLA